ncbi:MAG: 4Fe-4S binding protein [Spirochaetales bacterium]|nr:4Fe-4S binding protein [Spirochaetales bacterium]
MYKQSVQLIVDKCIGCTNCIKRCPTEAIRVQNGKAQIISDRCLDCGECIRVCQSNAKIAISDPLSVMDEYDYKIAIPAPSLYGIADSHISTDRILTGLKNLGFDDVFEVAAAAEIITRRTNEFLNKNEGRGPFISSSCPAVVRLVQVRFPSLIDQIIPFISPMELAAQIARNRAGDDKGKVGVFFISPCAAKYSEIRDPHRKEKSAVDAVIGIKDIQVSLQRLIASDMETEMLATASGVGIGWGRIDGEARALATEGVISVDGISNVISLLEELENGKIDQFRFIELMACPGGCVGGPMTLVNPYVAKSIILERWDKKEGIVCEECGPMKDIRWTEELASCNFMKLDDDYEKAMMMLQKLELIEKNLPGIDCGSCGAPTCHAFAEDIVRGRNEITSCIFVLRKKIRQLTDEMIKLEDALPYRLDKNE